MPATSLAAEPPKNPHDGPNIGAATGIGQEKTFAMVVWEAMLSRAAEKYPMVESHKAITDFLATAEGAELYQLYTSKDAKLPVSQWLASRKEQIAKSRDLKARLGVETAGEALTKLAKAHAPTDFDAGLRWAMKG